MNWKDDGQNDDREGSEVWVSKLLLFRGQSQVWERDPSPSRSLPLLERSMTSLQTQGWNFPRVWNKNRNFKCWNYILNWTSEIWFSNINILWESRYTARTILIRNSLMKIHTCTCEYIIGKLFNWRTIQSFNKCFSEHWLPKIDVAKSIKISSVLQSNFYETVSEKS